MQRTLESVKRAHGEAVMKKRKQARSTLTKRRKHPGGRPTKMTKEVQKQTLEGIELGMSRERAAAFAGVSVAVFYAFQSKFPEFQERVKEAEAKCLAFHLAQICRAAKPKIEGGEGHWQASAWVLERKWPEEWGKVDRHLLRVRRDKDEDLTQLPEAYINAIGEALGMRGKFVPLGPPLLEGENGETIDTEILPQD